LLACDFHNAYGDGGSAVLEETGDG
jgi:hypothetical protein